MQLNDGTQGSGSPTFRGFLTEARTLAERLGHREIEVPAFLEQYTRLTNAAIGCSRTGVWVFVDTAEGRMMRCLAMYDSIADQMRSVREWRNVQPYFDALEHEGFLSTSDVTLHPATAGAIAQRLSGLGVRSLLASSCSINGRLYGALTCTQVGETRAWTGHQLSLLRQIGVPVSLALHRASRFTPTTGYGPLLD